MSRSRVRMGAPASWAATPPTTRNSMPWCNRTCKRPRKLVLGGSAMPELGESVHPVLKQLEALEGRQGKGPANQREIDAVGRLGRRIGPQYRLGRSGLRPGRLGHVAY